MYRYIEIGDQRIGLFSLCVALGLLCIVFLNMWQLKRFKINLDFENKILCGTPWALLFGVVTGIWLDAVLRGGWIGLIMPWRYGLTFYGWLIGCIIFFIFYSKRVGIKADFFLNLFLPGFAIAQSFGRIGCFLGGCCWGQPSDFCGVIYPEGSPPYEMFGATPLLPVQLFESAWLMLVFIVLITLVRFRYRGAWYLILAPVGRIFLEFFRADERGGIDSLVFSPSQIIGCMLCISGVILLRAQVARFKKRRQKVQLLLQSMQ